MVLYSGVMQLKNPLLKALLSACLLNHSHASRGLMPSACPNSATFCHPIYYLSHMSRAHVVKPEVNFHPLFQIWNGMLLEYFLFLLIFFFLDEQFVGKWSICSILRHVWRVNKILFYFDHHSPYLLKLSIHSINSKCFF